MYDTELLRTARRLIPRHGMLFGGSDVVFCVLCCVLCVVCCVLCVVCWCENKKVVVVVKVPLLAIHPSNRQHQSLVSCTTLHYQC
jgi:hypothetical protein